MLVCHCLAKKYMADQWVRLAEIDPFCTFFNIRLYLSVEGYYLCHPFM